MKFPILGWPVFRGYASFRAMSRALASVTYPIQPSKGSWENDFLFSIRGTS